MYEAIAACAMFAFIVVMACAAIAGACPSVPEPKPRPPGWLVEDIKAAWRRWRGKH